MKLKEFVEQFVEGNSIVRLWHPISGGHHRIVGEDMNVVDMAWKIVSGEGVYSNLVDSEVIGLTSILVGGPYSEAVNLVIEEW